MLLLAKVINHLLKILIDLEQILKCLLSSVVGKLKTPKNIKF